MVEHLNWSDFLTEVLLALAEHLPLNAKIILSTASSHLRRVLAATVFRAIRITNLAEFDVEALDRVVETHGAHVQHILFRCFLFPNRETANPDEDTGNEDEVVGDGNRGVDGDPEEANVVEGSTDADLAGKKRPENHLSDAAIALLQGVTLPLVRSFTVEFVPEDDFEGKTWVYDEYGVGGSIYITNVIEGMDDVASEEEKFSWRSLMTRAWRALSANAAVTSLEIRALPPKMTTVWREESWVSFLGRLEHLSIGLWGIETPEGWHSNTTDGYTSFMHWGLREYFFDHAFVLRALEIIADKHNPYGGTSILVSYHSPMNLGIENLPQLRQLTLQNCFHNKRLREFVLAHSGTLESLSLINCMGPASSIRF